MPTGGNQTIQHQLVSVAMSQVGVREVGGNNLGPQIKKYMESTWMPQEAVDKGFPWCAAFVTWCMEKACTNLGLSFKNYAYQGADAYGWDKWAVKQGWTQLPDTADAEPGDIVTFDFSHVGIVYDYDAHEQTVYTIEGNTNGRGTRESETGDGVWQKERPLSLVKTINRIPA